MGKGLLKILRSGKDKTISKALKGVKDKVKVTVSRGLEQFRKIHTMRGPTPQGRVFYKLVAAWVGQS